MRPALFFVVGSWCLSALVLGCAYNSLLISYVLGSNYQVLVVSSADLAKNSNIQIAVTKGNGVDLVLSVIQIRNEFYCVHRNIDKFSGGASRNVQKSRR